MSNPGALTINISSLPRLGTLSQIDFMNPSSDIPITAHNSLVTNALGGVKYRPLSDQVGGSDSFQFYLIHDGLVSSSVTVMISILAWDYPPSISTTPQVITPLPSLLP